MKDLLLVDVVDFDALLELWVVEVFERLVDVLLVVLVGVELPVVEDVLIEVCVDVVVDLEVVDNLLLELRVEVVELDVVVENIVELLVLDELEVLDALDAPQLHNDEETVVDGRPSRF